MKVGSRLCVVLASGGGGSRLRCGCRDRSRLHGEKRGAAAAPCVARVDAEGRDRNSQGDQHEVLLLHGAAQSDCRTRPLVIRLMCSLSPGPGAIEPLTSRPMEPPTAGTALYSVMIIGVLTIEGLHCAALMEACDEPENFIQARRIFASRASRRTSSQTVPRWTEKPGLAPHSL